MTKGNKDNDNNKEFENGHVSIREFAGTHTKSKCAFGSKAILTEANTEAIRSSQSKVQPFKAPRSKPPKAPKTSNPQVPALPCHCWHSESQSRLSRSLQTTSSPWHVPLRSRPAASWPWAPLKSAPLQQEDGVKIDCSHLAMGQKPVPPVNIPLPTNIGSTMGGEFTYQPKWHHLFGPASWLH